MMRTSGYCAVRDRALAELTRHFRHPFLFIPINLADANVQNALSKRPFRGIIYYVNGQQAHEELSPFAPFSTHIY